MLLELPHEKNDIS